jgi:hypothetical protein
MSGFVQIRRGILEHLQEGRLTVRDYACYSVIILLADKATGLWWGCAQALAAQFGAGDISVHAARRSLHNLEETGYLKRFRTQGQRGNSPILVNKYPISFGELKGRFVNAERTVDYRRIVTELASEDASDLAPVPASDPATELATLSRLETRDKRPEIITNLSRPEAAPTSKPEKRVDIPETYRQAAGRLSVRFAELTRSNPDKKQINTLAYQLSLAEYSEADIRELMEYGLTVDPWWSPKIQNLSFFTRNIPQLIAAQAAHARGKATFERCQQEKKNADGKPTAPAFDWRKNAIRVS